MDYKYVISNNKNPYFNLAMEYYLFEQATETTTILFLWQNENTIVIGRNQNPYAECNVEQFLANGGKLARRKSGGGAVYHDDGNLNYSIISNILNKDRCAYHTIISNALSLLDVHIEFNGRNDLIIQNKKISGNAFYTDNHTLCQHGTLLINSSIENMSCFLTPNINKLNRNSVKSVASRVINLTQINPSLTIEKVQTSLICSLEATPLVFCLNDNKLHQLVASFSSDDWIFRRTFK